MDDYFLNRIMDHTVKHIKQHHESWKRDIVDAYYEFFKKNPGVLMNSKVGRLKGRVYALTAAEKHVMQASRETKDPYVRGYKSDIARKLRDEALKDV